MPPRGVLAPVKKRRTNLAFEAVLRWGDTVLDFCSVAEARAVVLGTGGPFSTPDLRLEMGAPRFVLARHLGDAAEVRVPPGAEAELLLGDGLACAVERLGRLEPQERLRIRFGDFELEAYLAPA
jgi:hypothetical protein